MSFFKLKFYSAKWSLIPVGLTLAISIVQFFIAQQPEEADFTAFDRFVLTNTFGLLLTLLLEVLQRWSSEEQIIKLTKHLDTHSPVFQALLNLIEDVDAAFCHATLIKHHYDDLENPLIKQLQQTINTHKAQLELLKIGFIEREYTDSLLTNALTEKVLRILAVSDPATDLHFWNSPEGKSSWEAQLRSNALQVSNYSTGPDGLPRSGICRIFILPQTIITQDLDSFLSVIVQQVRSGVNARVLFNSNYQGFEGAIFGDIAFRQTQLIGVSGAKQNSYCFDSNKVLSKVSHFGVSWNSAWAITPELQAQREVFSRESLVNLLIIKGFVIQ